jgi:hypothetical protein
MQNELFYNSRRTKDITQHLTTHAVLCVSVPRQRPVVTDMCLALAILYLAMDNVFYYWQRNLGKVFTEPLSNNGRPTLTNYSGFQPSYYNMFRDKFNTPEKQDVISCNAILYLFACCPVLSQSIISASCCSG